MSNLYYAISLAAFIAALWFGGRNSRKAAIDAATTTLLTTQAEVIAAQGERIALLERDKKDMAELIGKQGTRIEYLEELLLGGANPTLVQTRSVSELSRRGRKSGTAHPSGGDDR